MPPESRKWFVYGLIDPRYGAIYYVGCSVKPKLRVLSNWTTTSKELRAAKIRPELVILAVHDTYQSGLAAERAEIKSRKGLENLCHNQPELDARRKYMRPMRGGSFHLDYAAMRSDPAIRHWMNG